VHLALVVVIEGEGATFGRNGLGEVGATAGGTEGHDGRGKVVEECEGWRDEARDDAGVGVKAARKTEGMW